LALAGSDPHETKQVARQFRISRLYDSAEELLADPGVDVVHITTPADLHFAQVRAALEARKHVVCEAPLAMNPRESNELARLAAQKRVANAVVFNLRYYPPSQHARVLARGTELGDVYVVQGSCLQDWRLAPIPAGEIFPALDVGGHLIDLISYVTGLEVEAVMADMGTFSSAAREPARLSGAPSAESPAQGHDDEKLHGLEARTDDYASVFLRYSDGARGVLTVSQISAGHKNRAAYEIDGSRHSIAWNSDEPYELWIGHWDRPNQMLRKDRPNVSEEGRSDFGDAAGDAAGGGYPSGVFNVTPDPLGSLCRDFYGYLDRDDFAAAPTFPTFEDGHRERLVAEAILRSAREERWIVVPDVSDSL
jgi:predicted dehydrogenase